MNHTITRTGRDNTWSPSITPMQRDRMAAPFEADIEVPYIKLAIVAVIALVGYLFCWGPWS